MGTVQFGLDYGISNNDGQVSEVEVEKIFSLAETRQVEVIDTAAAYGSSEEVIGRVLHENSPFKIVTKTLPLNKGGEIVTVKEANSVKDRFYRSLESLGLPRVYGLMVHYADDALADRGGHLYSVLKELKESGLVEKIGVSVYSPEVLEVVLQSWPDIELVQFPLNIYDQRMLKVLPRLKERNIELHSRSLFLQGLFFLPAEKLTGSLAPFVSHHQKFKQVLSERKASVLAATMSFIQSVQSVDHVIVGAQNSEQLEQLLEAFENPAFDIAQGEFAHLASTEAMLIDPSTWKN